MKFVTLYVLFPNDNYTQQTGSGALIPLEMCQVIPGQIMRKQISQEKMKDVLAFATLRPRQRLNAIQDGLGVDRKSTRLNSSHSGESRMPSSA